MELIYKVSRLTPMTPAAAQKALLRALESVAGVSAARLIPESHEFAITTDGARHADVIKAATHAGFHVQNNVAD